jgi:hypothetical protein
VRAAGSHPGSAAATDTTRGRPSPCRRSAAATGLATTLGSRATGPIIRGTAACLLLLDAHPQYHRCRSRRRPSVSEVGRATVVSASARRTCQRRFRGHRCRGHVDLDAAEACVHTLFAIYMQYVPSVPTDFGDPRRQFLRECRVARQAAPGRPVDQRLHPARRPRALRWRDRRWRMRAWLGPTLVSDGATAATTSATPPARHQPFDCGTATARTAGGARLRQHSDWAPMIVDMVATAGGPVTGPVQAVRWVIPEREPAGLD